MIIDAHVHIDLNRFKDIKRACAEVIREMNKAGIDKAVLMPDNHLNKNNHLEEACRLFSDRFYRFGMVDPKQPKKKIKRDIDKLIVQKKCKGIKIHPRTQKFTLKDPGVFHIAHYIGLHKLPLVIDCLPVFKFVSLDERTYPNAFDELAKENASTNIIIAHMGGHRLMDAFGVAMGNPNIYLDVSYTFYFYKNSSVEKDMAFSVKKLGSNRIIYGSDHPGIGMYDGFKLFNKFCKHYKLDDNTKANMFSKNISELIHI
ncbi:MAG: amidohydrolase family protein [Candidatus Omnitrophica bacterium]|nr:amidohydrolase family protein [Candidatus Omnitrophota bacterium]